jgi:hypothetical protein
MIAAPAAQARRREKVARQRGCVAVDGAKYELDFAHTLRVAVKLFSTNQPSIVGFPNIQFT